MIEIEKSAEEIVTSPTSLELFRAKGSVFSKIVNLYEAGLEFQVKQKRAIVAIQNNTDAYKSRIDRLREASESCLEKDKASKSSITCGMVYLKMHDELTARGLNQQQIWDFFGLCLETNMAISKVTAKYHDSFRPGMDLSSRNRAPAADPFSDELEKRRGTPPEWFGNDQKKWQQFFLEHAVFATYLIDNYLNKALTGRASIHDGTIVYGNTFPDALPDWLTERDTPPVREEVEQELDDDRLEQQVINTSFARIVNQVAVMLGAFFNKSYALYGRTISEEAKLFPTVESISELLILLETCQNDGMPAVVDEIEKLIGPDLGRQFHSMKQNPELVIRTYVKHIGFRQPELIAVGLEKIIEESRMVSSVNEPIGLAEAMALRSLIDNPKSQPTDLPSPLESLRSNNKKAFNCLFYEIRPILSMLSEEDCGYLRESLEAYAALPIEHWIWDLADLVAQRAGEGALDLSDERSVKIGTEVLENSFKWLRQNHVWAYDNLAKYIKSRPAEPATSILADETQELSIPDDFTEEIEELEKETLIIERGPLADWQVLYTTDHTLDPKHLVSIDGQTVDERGSSLRFFVRKENIVTTVPPDKIISELEEIICIPEETENIAHAKVVNGVRWHKRGTSSMRIMYDLNRDAKQVIFFLHKKRDWHYRNLKP